MSVASEITRLQNAKSALKTSINAKTDSSHQINNETLEEYSDFVDSIQTGSGGQQYRLPDAYQEVEYIESSGTQYFNTGYYANGNSQFEFDITYKTNSGVVFGAYNSGWATGYGYYHNNTSNYYEYIHYYSNNSINYRGSTNTTQSIVIDKGYVYINNALIHSETLKTIVLSYPTYILAGNWVGSRAEQPISAKLYFFKIKENDLLVHNYIPCYRKSDDVIGMYDLIEEEFITNAGTGVFTKGPNHDTPLANLQNKSILITENTITNVSYDSGYDGLGTVEITTNVSGSGADLTEYFNTEITSSNYSYFARDNLVKKAPTITVNTNCTSMQNSFNSSKLQTLKVICSHTNLTNLNGAFRDMTKLTSIDLTEFNTTSIKDMSLMFHGCSSLLSLNLSNITTQNVTNMSSMFGSCYALTSIDVSQFNTSNVTNMSSMFGSGSASSMGFTTLNLSNFNTEKVTNMSSMFRECQKLTSLNVSSFNTEKVTNMSDMFTDCKNLTSLNLSNFETPLVTNMSGLFLSCSKLETLDISNFDFSSVTSYASIFRLCGTSTATGLTKVYVKDETAQNWILNLGTNGRPSTWTTDNVIIAGSEADLRS